VLAYAAAWLVAAAVCVVVVRAVFGGNDGDVTVPPVRATQLGQAAAAGHCILQRSRGDEQLNPPVDGPAGERPARAGFYDDPLPSAALTAAVRHGLIVIQFRPDVAADVDDELHAVQAAVPAGTVVAPNATHMSFAVAVTSYRRLLGCPSLDPSALDAVRLFRGRFLGSGPESR
jgi:hypothetical protein